MLLLKSSNWFRYMLGSVLISQGIHFHSASSREPGYKNGEVALLENTFPLQWLLQQWLLQ